MHHIFRTLVPALFALAAITGWTPAAAADCTAAERAVADRALQLSASDQRASIAAHLPWGAPRETVPADNERLLVQRDFVIRHDGDLRVPLWTAERVDAARLGRIPREDCFRADPRLPAAEAGTPRDYDEPIYDQGHMAPFANQTSSAVAGHNSFVMSNMTPQTCQLNRGIWQILEGITRLWATEHGTVYVLSGSVFDRDGNGRRDADSAARRMRSRSGTERVAVPSHFYKVIAIRRPDGSVSTLSIMLPHNEANPDGPAALRYLQQHVTTIEAIEQVAGIDVFPSGARIEEARTLWPFTGRQPRSLCNVGRTTN
ncbi:DNA/RNA non-specific endonuclease [Allosphingosinicella sp.]|jgi:DNA/RNA endonuclease G (NUC1)|uniref:DNA/RNA non-specific endonuclease n=1 Tax=Allosphingosinicella sp. TaxID=2823234 RepID=UPI002F01AFDF